MKGSKSNFAKNGDMQAKKAENDLKNNKTAAAAFTSTIVLALSKHEVCSVCGRKILDESQRQYLL